MTTAMDRPPRARPTPSSSGGSGSGCIIIPNGVYHGFTAVGTEPAGIINIPTELYDYDEPDEFRRPFDDPEIGYDWDVTSE